MLPACFLLLGLTLAAAGEVHISEFKVPNEVKEGKDVELRCEHSLLHIGDYIKWWFTPHFRDDKKVLYLRFGNRTGEAASSRVRINQEDQENDTIQIVNMQPSDSGVYECEVSHKADEDRRSHKLVVYTPGTGPQLSPNITKVQTDSGEEVVLVTCNADGVFPKPDLFISIDGIEQEPNSSMISSNDVGLYDIETNVTVNDSNHQFTAFCELTYDKDSDVAHEPFQVQLQYGTGGDDDPIPAENIETTTEAGVTTTTAINTTDGSTVLHWSWMSLLAAAALAHTLTPH